MNDFLQSLRNGQAEKQRTQKSRKNYDNPFHHSSSGPRFQPYGNNTPYNRQQPMKRQPMPPQGNEAPIEESALIADTIENLTSHIETLVRTQEYMANIQERTAEQLERLAIATERIVNHLDISLLQENNPAPEFENHYTSSQEDISAQVEETAAPQIAEKANVQPSPATSRQKTKQVLRRRKNAAVQKIEIVEDVANENNGELMGRDQVMDLIYTMRDQGATFDQVAKRLIELGQPTFSGRGEWHAQTVHRLCARN
jgi:hypothetical protein